ncbi:MAG: PhzF family phenazine biosynthesis protein [Jatrophihabitans sp.]
MRLRTVDAFTDRAFGGNPAGVIRLDGLPEPPPERWLAALAAEINLAETAFVAATDHGAADFGLRWFTPTVEVDLCGHATLAAAHCLFADGLQGPLRFATRSGVLTVTALPDGSRCMDFPAGPATRIVAPPGLAGILGAEPVWVGLGGTNDYLVELADAATVRSLAPDLARLARLPVRGVMVTAASDVPEADFVSRFFGPAVGVAEDPVTGSAHTVLGPYWASRSGRDELVGLQVSPRTGLVGVRLVGDRVLLSGRAVTVLDARLSAEASAFGQYR